MSIETLEHSLEMLRKEYEAHIKDRSFKYAREVRAEIEAIEQTPSPTWAPGSDDMPE